MCRKFIDFEIRNSVFVDDHTLKDHIVNTKVVVAGVLFIFSVDEIFIWSYSVSQLLVLN